MNRLLQCLGPGTAMVTIVISTLAFTNCDASFWSREVSKTRLISSQPVFIPSRPSNLEIPIGGQEEEEIETCLSCISPAVEPTPLPSPVPSLENPSTEMPIKRLCSSGLSEMIGNLSTSSVETILFREGAIACRFDGAEVQNSIMASRQFSLSAVSRGCQNLPDGEYLLAISPKFKWNVDPLEEVTNSQPQAWNRHYVKRNFLRTSRSYVDLLGSDYFHPKYDFYLKKVNGQWVRSPLSPNSNEIWVLSYNSDELNVECNGITSPLVIRMDREASRPDPLVLTSQANGIYFDILGEMSFPSAHTPKRISWHRSPFYYFLALPDANGLVRGINELFGNATRGPDGKFAANGYAALEKFDGRSSDGRMKVDVPNKIIDERDAVFNRLRVWRDVNFDGNAQAYELFSLSDVGIRYIDLDYDASFAEVDRYGNETRYKSVVGTQKGTMHLIFDLWFKYFD